MIAAETILILFGWMIAGASPGPATLAISSAAMSGGRRAGLTLAAGVVAGSASWGIAAALGMSALMLANAWVFEVIRYLGAAYLFYLALKSLRSAWRGGAVQLESDRFERLFLRGLLLHLTNPKAILAWGAIYSIALPVAAEPSQIWSLFLMLSATSMGVFFGYGILFSNAVVVRGYAASKRWFDGVFALLFGVVSLKILTAKLEI